jgi:hypothetical protein
LWHVESQIKLQEKKERAFGTISPLFKGSWGLLSAYPASTRLEQPLARCHGTDLRNGLDHTSTFVNKLRTALHIGWPVRSCRVSAFGGPGGSAGAEGGGGGRGTARRGVGGLGWERGRRGGEPHARCRKKPASPDVSEHHEVACWTRRYTEAPRTRCRARLSAVLRPLRKSVPYRSVSRRQSVVALPAIARAPAARSQRATSAAGVRPRSSKAQVEAGRRVGR